MKEWHQAFGHQAAAVLGVHVLHLAITLGPLRVDSSGHAYFVVHSAHQRFTFNKNSSARTRLNLCAEFIPAFIFCRLPGVKWIFIFGKGTGLIYILELKMYIKTGKWRCVKYIRRSIKATYKKKMFIYMNNGGACVTAWPGRALNGVQKNCPVVANWKQLNDAKWNIFQGRVWFSGENIRCSRGHSFCGAVCCLCCVVSANFQVIYHSLKNVKFYSVENIKLNALKMIPYLKFMLAAVDQMKLSWSNMPSAKQ